MHFISCVLLLGLATTVSAQTIETSGRLLEWAKLLLTQALSREIPREDVARRPNLLLFQVMRLKRCTQRPGSGLMALDGSLALSVVPQQTFRTKVNYCPPRGFPKVIEAIARFIRSAGQAPAR
jgi:hypothetical protein